MTRITKRTRQFQCFYHPDFQTNSIVDFKYHLTLHTKVRNDSDIDKKIPEALIESSLINKELLL